MSFIFRRSAVQWWVVRTMACCPWDTHLTQDAATGCRHQGMPLSQDACATGCHHMPPQDAAAQAFQVQDAATGCRHRVSACVAGSILSATGCCLCMVSQHMPPQQDAATGCRLRVLMPPQDAASGCRHRYLLQRSASHTKLYFQPGAGCCMLHGSATGCCRHSTTWRLMVPLPDAAA